MSLLREIQDAAVDGNTPLPAVLRKCMVLAARLGHEPFKKWVDEELNGYPLDADLPPYRRLTGATSIGNFSGHFGRTLRNVPLPLAPLPAEVRAKYSTMDVRDGAARLADLAKPHGDGLPLILRWPPDLVAQVAYQYFQGYALLEAHIEIPKSAIVGVLDAVRTNVLKFALEIEEQDPAAGEVAPGTRPLSEEKVTQIFNTNIWRPQNVAVGSPGTVQYAQHLEAGNVEDLKRFLLDRGLEPTDIAELEEAIAADPKPQAGKSLGGRVAGWIGKMVSKAASGAWNIGTSSAAELLTSALKAYYGLADD